MAAGSILECAATVCAAGGCAATDCVPAGRVPFRPCAPAACRARTSPRPTRWPGAPPGDGTRTCLGCQSVSRRAAGRTGSAPPPAVSAATTADLTADMPAAPAGVVDAAAETLAAAATGSARLAGAKPGNRAGCATGNAGAAVWPPGSARCQTRPTMTISSASFSGMRRHHVRGSERYLICDASNSGSRLFSSTGRVASHVTTNGGRTYNQNTRWSIGRPTATSVVTYGTVTATNTAIWPIGSGMGSRKS